MKAIETINLSFTYPDGTKALENVNLTIEKGEKVAILGPNGAGKSTLIYHFNGLLMPTSGKVKVLGREVSKENIDFIRQKVGLVFQNPDDQVFAPTVFQDVAFGPINLGLPEDEVKRRVKWALEVMELNEVEDKPPHRLSHGQKKRVAIAGVLAMHPEIIALDEPTANLDPKAVSKILELLLKLNKELNATLIIATHDVDFVPLCSDKVCILNRGELILEGSPGEVFSNTEKLRRMDLRLPRIGHLFEILKVRDNLPIENPLPLTIGEARREIHRLIKHKTSINNDL
ncbi:MAG: ATP-binding cassette domain-containing protein [Candidatus Bathyarchaeia archaeon]|nr:ATP-binding cassette domain-containing protein [Candidatus Bathyarchaeota archaeon]